MTQIINIIVLDRIQISFLLVYFLYFIIYLSESFIPT